MIILDSDIAVTSSSHGYGNSKYIGNNIHLEWKNLCTTALSLATVWMQDVVDKNGKPQILHAIRVGEAARDACKGYEADRATFYIVGVLHDILEDTDCPQWLVRKLFGDKICDAVVAITRFSDEKYRDYLHRCCKNDIARKIKRCDIEDNLRPDRYFEGVPIKRYFDSLRYIYEYEAGLV